MKKLTKKQIGIIAIIAVVVIAIIGFFIGFSLKDKKENEIKEPTFEQTEDKDAEVKKEDIMDTTEDYVVINVKALEKLIDMEFVSGDDTTFTVSVDGKELVFTVGSTIYTVDGEEKEMKTSAVKVEDAYGIEIETVINDLGHKVTISRIDGEVTNVVITKNNVPKKETDSSDGAQNEEENKDEEQTSAEKTTMYSKSDAPVRSGAGTSHSQIGNLTKGQKVVKIGEENGWCKIEFDGNTGYVKSEYLSTSKVESSSDNQGNSSQTTTKPNESTGNNTTGNNSSNNNNGGNNSGSTTTPSTPSTPSTPTTPEPEKNPYAGMYNLYDNTSYERFNKCVSILKSGYAGEYMNPTKTFANYFVNSIVVSNGTTDGAWMYMNIGAWSTVQGSEETDATYKQLPSLVKQCLEIIAPQGGTELYNKVNALILQYGHPCYVPSQGKVSESIPGLTVTINQGKSGVEIEFWPE